MEPTAFLDHLRREVDAFSSTLHRIDPELPIEYCPGWSAADLGRHLGSVHRSSAASIGAEQRPEPTPGPAKNTAVADWYDESATILVDALSRTSPEDPAWPYVPGAGRSEFWFRRQALETAIHRWDLENGSGLAGPIDPDLAAAGLVEVRDWFVPRRFREIDEPFSVGRLNFIPTDLPTTAVTFGNGPRLVSVSGDASSLLLLAWGRTPLDSSFEVEGDEALLRAFLEQGLTP